MEKQSVSAPVGSPSAPLLVVIPMVGIVTLVSMTLVGMIPHSVASPAALSRTYYSMFALALMVLVCAIGAERARGVAATTLAATGAASLVAWFVLATTAAFFSWNGHDWADNSHVWLRSSSLLVAVLAYLVLTDFGSSHRVRRH